MVSITRKSTIHSRSWTCGILAFAAFFVLVLDWKDDRSAVVDESGAKGSTTMSLTVLSWNVAKCEPSGAAPITWHADASLANNAVRGEILRHAADIIALQETPEPEWSARNLGDDYVSMGTTPSHWGFVDLLLSKNLVERLAKEPKRVFLDDSQPTVAAVMRLSTGQDITVASMHLHPHKRYSHNRLRQMQALLASTPTDQFIFMGDMNMRSSEDGSVETLLQQPKDGKSATVLDAWKATGSNPDLENTWDTYVNKYYGDETVEYQRRYDRIYVGGARGENVNGTMSVTKFSLIAHESFQGRTGHYLSDHFGLLARLSLPIS